MEITMPWTETTRSQYRRDGLRFASDTTDAEWALLEPVMPAPAGIGRPRTTELRAVVDAALDRAGLLLSLARRWHLALHQPQAR
jgi:transposase